MAVENSQRANAKAKYFQPVAIIGAGPAGLMAAEVIARAGYAVEIYDAMPSVGRKFLLAGVGGMNITHSEDGDKFLSRYSDAQTQLKPMLEKFGALQLREWVHGLGIETFIGSSGRVFPKEMKAAPLLRAWLHRLRELGVKIFPRHRWVGWSEHGELVFEMVDQDRVAQKNIHPSVCVFALGGGSWKKLGSNGDWVNYFREKNIDIASLQPSNCGFEVAWSEKFKNSHSGDQLSTVVFSLGDGEQKNAIHSEAVVTAYGIEGTGIYAMSRLLRKQLIENGCAPLVIDLMPDWGHEKIVSALSKPKGKNSISNFLRKQLNLSSIKIALVWEFATKAEIENPFELAKLLKNLTLELTAMRPIDEAISTAGGVAFTELTETLMLKKIPGVFCAGEMLDWEAPTGGYLLTACFATGVRAGEGVVKYLNKI